MWLGKQKRNQKTKIMTNFSIPGILHILPYECLNLRESGEITLAHFQICHWEFLKSNIVKISRIMKSETHTWHIYHFFLTLIESQNSRWFDGIHFQWFIRKIYDLVVRTWKKQDTNNKAQTCNTNNNQEHAAMLFETTISNSQFKSVFLDCFMIYGLIFPIIGRPVYQLSMQGIAWTRLMLQFFLCSATRLTVGHQCFQAE